MSDSSQMRQVARQIFQHALAEASIAKGFARHVNCERGILRVCEDLYDLQTYSNVLVVSLGKAGHTMVEALSAQVGASLEGIVASSVHPPRRFTAFSYFRGGHPTPNAESMQAATAMLRALESQPASALVIFLLSGGGSSIVEKPIDDEISLDDLICDLPRLGPFWRAHRRDQRGPQTSVGGERRSVWRKLRFRAQQVSLLVSDVPDSTPDALASGPTMPIPRLSRTVIASPRSTNCCDSFRHRRGNCSSATRSTRPRSRTIWRFTRRVGGPCCRTRRRLKKPALRQSARASSCTWTTPATIGTTRRPPITCCRRVRELRKQFSPVCLISGGEVTVKVTNGGVGGRNQQFALACAEKIAG